MESTGKRNFKDFKFKVIQRTPISDQAYIRRSYRTTNPVASDFTLEEILDIIRSGDLQSLRELSRYFYRTNSLYRNNIDFLARLFLYDTMVIPIYQEGKGSKTQITKAFYNACAFIDSLDVPSTFRRITTEWLKSGVYYGILRTDGEKNTIQDLPIRFCRSRFKDFNNLNILEFDLNYFDTITDEKLRLESILTFPEIVQSAWKQWNKKRNIDSWVMIPAADGGVSFSFFADQTPPLIASIPALKKLDDAIKREEKRDENELYKLLIQKMPVDKDGELVFQLDEIAEIHASIADMLQEIDTVDVLTTLGDTKLESLQENTAATQSADRINKYKNNAWDALGRGQILFNPDGSSSLAYAIKKDETIMQAYLDTYETWIKYHLNNRFSRTNLTFDFEILPTTVFNRKEIQGTYFQGAQYGYSKMFAGVVMGIKQMNQLSLMNFENEFLEMSSKMVPLQSTYTTPGNAVANEEKNNSSAQKSSNTAAVQDINNTGGRPELPDEQKSEKTQANNEASG